MTEQVAFPFPDRLIKAEEVIAGYVQKYGFYPYCQSIFWSKGQSLVRKRGL